MQIKQFFDHLIRKSDFCQQIISNQDLLKKSKVILFKKMKFYRIFVFD